MSKCQRMLLIVGAITTIVRTVRIGPDTAIVDEDTYYELGYDHYTLKKLEIAYKFKYSNPLNLDLLVDLEYNLYSNMSRIYSDYIKAGRTVQDEFMASLQEYLEDFEGTSLAMLRTFKNTLSVTDVLATNIITPFLTMRRFRNYIRPWMLSVKKSTKQTALEEAVLRHINSIYKLKDGPFRVEFHFAMIAIILPHFIYEVKAEDLAEGRIRGRNIGVQLKASHCLEIGIHGVAMGMFPIGIEWLEVAIKKITSGDSSASLGFAVDWLDKAIGRHDSWWMPTDPLQFTATYYSKPIGNMTREDKRTWHKQITCKEGDKMEKILNPLQFEPFHLHWSVCKGDTGQTAAEKSKLFCYYEKQVDPVWRIGPLKAELLSTWPHVEVIRFYDLVSQELMTEFKADPNKSHYHDSFIIDKFPAPKKYLATVFSTASPRLKRKVSTLSQAASGLVIGNRDVNLEAVTYVPGGHSFIHRDWQDVQDVKKSSPDALALLFIYIDQPEQGGETSFAKSHLLVEPILGSGILVFNLLQSGRMDSYAPHGACPVTIGRKWVIAKDFMYQDQHHLKCAKDQRSRYEFLVNGKTKY